LRFAEQVQQNERLRAQVAALTAQMQPHFLFNALNSLAMSVRESPKLAEELIVALSELYRAVLKASTGSVHSVAAELAICRAYVELEKLRFGSRLELEVEVAAGAEEREVPVMLLQTLVENAVRHGLVEREDGRVKIGVGVVGSELRIDVDDNGVGIDAVKSGAEGSGSGHGLANCRARLALHYGEGARIEVRALEPRGTRASVVVPVAGGRL
jgi:two-component system LytT family sensor kinase